jgi:hypothetical protein
MLANAMLANAMLASTVPAVPYQTNGPFLLLSEDRP